MREVDIWDLAYVDTHEELISPERKARYSNNILRLFYGWWRLLYLLIRGVFSDLFHKKNDFEYCKYALFAFTGNNYRSLEPIKNKLSNACLFTIDIFPKRKIYCFGLLYSPIVFYKYLKSSGFQKEVYCTKFATLCVTYGYYIEATKFLQKIKPEFVIVANDHSSPQRSCFRAAQNLGITTIYIQHASVTENFPPLEFDYAFLDGQESLDKYKANGKACKSTVFLSGNPRFDIIKTLTANDEKTDNIFRTGIAIGAKDNLDKVNDLICNLYKIIDSIEVSVRPHPAMKVDSLLDKKMGKYPIKLSNSKKENPFVFINKNDVFISGESSFHLDVALSGKKSYYYNFSDHPALDWYGYLKSGLIEDITDCSEMQLKEKISANKNIDTSLISFYVSNYNTAYWGRCAELISSTLSQLAQSEIPDFWEMNGEKIYELKNI
jgi:hypothetical protein